MAIRFLIAFILITCGASAQVFQTNNVPYKFRGLKADSMLVVPSGSDTAHLANPKWGESMTGALFAKTGDSTLWMKIGSRWVKISSAGTTIDTTSLSNRINQKVDSVTSSNDSLYYWKNGTATYVNSFTGFDTAVVVKAQVHNAESTTLLAGEVVYSFGATGNLMSVKRAWNKQDATSSKTFGVVRKDIPAGGVGWIVTNGVVDKLNLGAYSEGDQVYLDSIPGKFTATKPYAPYHMVAVGVIERANNGNGQIYVKVQNGYELEELHNVSARFPLNNQVLKFRTSDSLWHNATDTGITSLTAGIGLTGGTITTTGTVAADTNVLSTRAWRQKGIDSLSAVKLNTSDTSTMLTNYTRGSGVANQVALWNGTRLLIGSNNFVLNNRRVGIGTSSPTAQLNIQQPALDSNLTAIGVSGYSLTGSNAQPLMDLSGTWNTSANVNAFRLNITDVASGGLSNLISFAIGGSQRFAILKGGALLFGANVSRPSIGGGNPINAQYLTDGLALNLGSAVQSNQGYGINLISSTGTRTTTSGTNGNVRIAETFNPTSGTGTYDVLTINNTINQTGGANGITRGVFVNPTLTSAADWRSIEWSNNTGRGIWGTGTAENAMAGPTTIGAAASPNAAAVLDLTSTTRGFLPPRMTAVQRTGIANKAGLLVWDTDSSRYMLNNGSAWRGLLYTGEGGGGGTSGVNYISADSAFVGSISGVGKNGTATNSPAGNGTNVVGKNIMIGPSVGQSVTTGRKNVSIGNRTLQYLTTGSSNIAIGDSALLFLAGNTGNSNNVAIGNQALISFTGNANGVSATAIGNRAAASAVSTITTAIGDKALELATGDANTAVGASSLATLVAGTNNTAVGYQSGLRFNAGASSNTLIGHQVAAAGSSGAGTANVAIGNATLFVGAASSNNTAVGSAAGSGLTTGIRNTLLGSYAGQNATITGNNNIGIGANILLPSPTVSNQLVIGAGSSSNTWMLSDVSGSTRRWTFNGTTTDITATTASAALEIRATAGGFLPPRMTSANVAAITSPATGLSVYDSTDKTNDVYDGTRWNNQPNGLKNSATLDFGNTTAQTSTDLTITVTGAAEGDMVFLGTSNASVNANTNFTAWVSAANTVTIRFNNYSSGAVDPASGTFRVYVIKN